MKTINLSQLIIAESRQRKTFDEQEHQKLIDSISRLGLLHAPVLRATEEGLQLVAGERRIRALTDMHNLGTVVRYEDQIIPVNHIPYVLLSDLDALAAEEAELEENTHRVDLTWQDKAQAVARLSELRTKQAIANNLSAPSIADISAEIRGRSAGACETTRREIILAKHLDNPIVKEAKNADEAFKALAKAEERAKREELGKQVGRTFTSSKHQVLNEDSLLWLARCPDEQFDVILTDPPYGMGADEFGDSGGSCEGAHNYHDSAEYYEEILDICSVQLLRIAKPNAHLYWFCDIDKFQRTKELFAESGWRVFRTPLIWHKPSAYRAPWPEHGPQRKYETILYAIKGERKTLKLGGDVITCPPDKNLGHQAQKPIALFEDLLSRSASPGDTVLDLFCGSGTIFVAANNLKCYATGIERDPVNYGLALQRLGELK